jgi:hypothetical protein
VALSRGLSHMISGRLLELRRNAPINFVEAERAIFLSSLLPSSALALLLGRSFA